MQNPNSLPRFPSFVAMPLAAVPAPLKSAALGAILNRLFTRALVRGDLDFLDGRRVNVVVTDAGIRFSVRGEHGVLVVGDADPEPDLEFRGSAHAFLDLASGAEDSDTLFFRRRIMTSGDTELGLYVKNFLEGLEPASLQGHAAISYTLMRARDVAAALETLRPRMAGTLGRLRTRLAGRP